MTTEEQILSFLEEEIKENIEYLSTTEGDELECISIENLEGILGRFFERKINLSLN